MRSNQDSRDNSDIRVDAFARALHYLCSDSRTHTEALWLLAREDLETMWRVWMRLDKQDRAIIYAEGQLVGGMPAVVLGFLRDRANGG